MVLLSEKFQGVLRKKNLIRKYFFFLLFIYANLLSLVFSSEKDDFIFVSEIPVYTPFQQPLIPKDLIELEKQYLPDDQHRCSPLQLQTYRIRPPGKSSTRWRGKVTVFEKQSTAQLPQQQGFINSLEDENHIKKIVRLFQEQSFSSSVEESHKVFPNKMRLVLLANRMESIFETKNKSLTEGDYEFENTLVMRGLWEPLWEHLDEHNKYKPAKIIEVRCYVHDLLHKLSNPWIPLEEKQPYQEEITRLIDEEAGKTGHVPYHELREHLRTHPLRKDFIDAFVAQHPSAQLYEATHDSDLVGLRLAPDGYNLTSQAMLGTTGLYTYYLSLLRSHASGTFPDVLTTGYRIAYEPDRFEDESAYAWLYQAIEEERYARAAASRVDFRASYIPEPNCLYKVHGKRSAVPYSFLLLPNNKTPLSLDKHNQYAPCETRAITHQIYNQNQHATVLFDPKHPVLMQAPERMLNYKNSRTRINSKEFGYYDSASGLFHIEGLKVLGLSSKVSQSIFSYRDYAIFLYGQFGLVGGSKKNYDLFRSVVPSILKYFDLYYYEPRNGFLSPPQRLDLTYKTDGGKTEPKAVELIDYLNWVADFGGAQDQLSVLELFLNVRFGDRIGTHIVNIARSIGQAREAHHRAYFLRQKGWAESRTSPKAAIDQRPDKKQVSPVKLVRRKVAVKEELFPTRHQDLRSESEKETHIEENTHQPPSAENFSRKVTIKISSPTLLPFFSVRVLGGSGDIHASFLS